ncbi:MAG TPA: cobalamin-binding protein [Ktedonobacterales bacterium]|nr:cobalamin-binding protein [Ktedonobacterales bacterium]
MPTTLRIVSLLASGTEMVAALGSLDQLVGRSHECDYPPEVAALPALSRIEIDLSGGSAAIDAQVKERVAVAQTAPPDALRALSLYQIDSDLLHTLQPDVIITQTQCDVCAVSERDVEYAVQQMTGVKPRIVALAPHRLADVWEDLIRVGQAIGKEEHARDLVANYKRRLADIADFARQQEHRPRVAMLEWLDPLMGAGNWMPELVTLAGGDPVFGEIGQHSPWLSWDELLAADPDVLVLAPCGYDLPRTLEDVPLLRVHPAWQSLTAVRNGQVYAADGNAFFNRSGPRLVESAEILSAIFYRRAMHVQWWQQIV